MHNRQTVRYRHLITLALLLGVTAIWTAPAQAGCGCDKPPPIPAILRPNATYAGTEISIFHPAIQTGAAYTVTFVSSITGTTAAVDTTAVWRRDISDGVYKPQVDVLVPDLPLGPAQISVGASGAGNPLVVTDDADFTVVPQPLPMPAWEQKYAVNNFVAAVSRAGVIYLSLDLTHCTLPLTYEMFAKKIPLRFHAEDVVFHNTQGFLMQLLNGSIPGLFVVDQADNNEDSTTLEYSRHEFTTYFLQHAERQPHQLDPTDPNWHIDGSRHVDHNHLIVAINGYLEGTGKTPKSTDPYNALPMNDAPPVPGATLPFELHVDAYALFSHGMIGTDTVMIQDTALATSDVVGKNLVTLTDTSYTKGDVSAATVEIASSATSDGKVAADNTINVHDNSLAREVACNGKVNVYGAANVHGKVQGLNANLTDKAQVYGEVSGYTVSISKKAKVLNGDGTQPGKVTTGVFQPVQVEKKDMLSVNLPQGMASMGDVVIGAGEMLSLTPNSYLADSLTVADGGTLQIDNDGGPVTFYVTGAVQVAPNGTLTFTGTDPDTFALYVTPGGSVQLNGHGTLHGVVYAPDCPVQITGDGDYIGSFVAQRLDLGGQAILQFDNNLGKNMLLQAKLKAVAAAQQAYDKTVADLSKARQAAQQADANTAAVAASAQAKAQSDVAKAQATLAATQAKEQANINTAQQAAAAAAAAAAQAKAASDAAQAQANLTHAKADADAAAKALSTWQKAQSDAAKAQANADAQAAKSAANIATAQTQAQAAIDKAWQTAANTIAQAQAKADAAWAKVDQAEQVRQSALAALSQATAAAAS